MIANTDALELGWIVLSSLGALRAWYALGIARSDIRLHAEARTNGRVLAAAKAAHARVLLYLCIESFMLAAGLLSGLRPPQPGPHAYDAGRVGVIVLLYLVCIAMWGCSELFLYGRQKLIDAQTEER